MESKKELYVYKLNNEHGVLIETDNPKVQGLKPLEETHGIGFYTLEQIENHNIVQGDCKLTYDDTCAGGYYSDINDLEVIVCKYVMNIENNDDYLYEFV